MSSFMSPLLWQSTPFQHVDSVLDFLGAHDRWHAILANHTAAVPQYRLDDLMKNAEFHQRSHEGLAQAFGLAPPSDFTLYDLGQRQGWVLFMQIHALEHERLRVAAGV